MLGKSNVQAEELRNQLGDRLVGSWKLAADAMGMTSEELGKAIENRQVQAEDFIPKFTKALDKFADPAFRANMSKTNFQFKLFQAQFVEFKNQIFKAGLDDILGSTFLSLRHTLEAISPLLQRIVRWLSVGFHIATAPIRLLVAGIADLLDHFELLGDMADENKLVDYIMGGVAAVAMLYGQFKLISAILKTITKRLGIFNKLKGSVGDMCGCGDIGGGDGKKKGSGSKGGKGRLGKAAKAVGAGVATVASKVGPAARVAALLGGSAATGIGLALHSSKAGEGSDISPEKLKEQLKAAGISEKHIEEYKNKIALASILGLPATPEVLSKLESYQSMGPTGILTPEQRQQNVKITIGLDDNEMSKVLKVKSQEEDMDVLSNIAR